MLMAPIFQICPNRANLCKEFPKPKRELKKQKSDSALQRVSISTTLKKAYSSLHYLISQVIKTYDRQYFVVHTKSPKIYHSFWKGPLSDNKSILLLKTLKTQVNFIVMEKMKQFKYGK